MSRCEGAGPAEPGRRVGAHDPSHREQAGPHEGGHGTAGEEHPAPAGAGGDGDGGADRQADEDVHDEAGHDGAPRGQRRGERPRQGGAAGHRGISQLGTGHRDRWCFFPGRSPAATESDEHEAHHDGHGRLQRCL